VKAGDGGLDDVLPESITGDQRPLVRRQRGKRRAPSWDEVERWRKGWSDSDRVRLVLELIGRGAKSEEFKQRAGVPSIAVQTEDGEEQRPDLRGFDVTALPLADRSLVPQAGSSSTIAPDLSHAQLQGARLTGLDLRGANLYRASLQKATLRRVNLTAANLTRAHLEDADLREARLDDASVNFVRYTEDGWLDRGTIFRVMSLSRARNVDPMLERYSRDQDYLYNFKYRIRGSSVRRFMFFLWWLTSNYGNSLILWGAWTVLLIGVFAVLFAPPPDWAGSTWHNFAKAHGPKLEVPTALGGNRLTYVYFSVSTFMTLGMGDIRPLNLAAETLVTIEVVCGYVMFGVLISILANKIARRA